MIPVETVREEYAVILKDLRLAQGGGEGDSIEVTGLRSLCRDVADAIESVVERMADPRCPVCQGTAHIHKQDCNAVGAIPYFMVSWVKTTAVEPPEPEPPIIDTEIVKN